MDIILERMFKRYVDDSNQAAVVPPVGTKYDSDLRRIVQYEEETNERIDECEDSRLARVLREIANHVMEGILMEADFPSKNQDGKMPILDMKVWMCEEEGYILHQHYEKPVSNREVLHSQSAQSSGCKKSVHTQEILRRMLNTSSKLEWQEHGAPVVTDYMVRMREAGYGEGMRRTVLQHAWNTRERFMVMPRLNSVQR